MTQQHPIRLGVNIDHVATLRNARGGVHPDPVRSALVAEKAGADGITVHLREDRRHIREADVMQIKENVSLPINLEMAATDEMRDFALSVCPNAVCVVPEKRQELTTEGGLNVLSNATALNRLLQPIKAKNIRISLFLDPDAQQIAAAKEIGADVVELHTGAYANASGDARAAELQRLHNAAELLRKLSIECHAGHGLTTENVAPICQLTDVRELNIGHWLIGEALFVGLESAVRGMRAAIESAA